MKKMNSQKLKNIKKDLLRTGLLSGALLLSGCTNSVAVANTQIYSNSSQQQFDESMNATALICEGNDILIVQLQDYKLDKASSGWANGGVAVGNTYTLTTSEGDFLRVNVFNTIIINGNDSYEKAKKMALSLIDENGIIYDYNDQELLSR